MNSFQLFTIFFARQGYKSANFLSKIKSKQRQFRTLVDNEVLNKAVVAPVRNPIEGSRYQVGDSLFEHLPNGMSRHLKVFGVQSGGFSNVYTVIDLNEMKPYCLKENRALPGDENSKNKDLKLEAEISLSFGYHPHLVTTHSVFYFKNRLHLLTEYLPGTSLNFRLKENPLDLRTALKFALHICSAMLHARSIFPDFIHGDIKPGNCLITEDNQLKLSDFGQSVINQSSHKKDKNLPGGTYYYMSPEMFDPANTNRDFSDIYAFGVTLFEMLTGICPFSGSSRKEIAEQHRHSPPSFNLLKDNGLPESVIKLISACLEKNPSSRPKDFAEIESELKKIYKKELKESAPKTENFKASVKELIEQSVAFSELGYYERALSYINKALIKDKFSVEALAQKAILLLRQNQAEKALQLSQKAFSENENCFSTLFVHAKILFNLERIDESFKCLEKAMRIEPNNVSVLNLKGEVLWQKGQIYQALKCFEKSLVIDNSQMFALEKMAQIYFSESFIEKALNISEIGLEKDSRNVCLHKISGDIYYLQNQKIKAIESYKKVLTFSPDQDETGKLFVKSCYELFKSSNQETNTQFFRLISMAPHLFYEPKDVESSRNLIESLIKFLRENNSQVFILWLIDDAIISASEMVPIKLREDLYHILDEISTVRIEKNLASKLLYSIGKIYYRLEKIEKCKAIFNQSLTLFGSDEKSYYYLAACNEIEGNFQTSSEFYNKALQLNKFCELNRTGAKRVSAKLLEKSEFKNNNDSKKYFQLITKNISESVKWLNPKYLLAIVYLSLILFIGFSNIKLGISHYFIKLAKDLKSDDYAVKALNVEDSNPEVYNTRGLLFLGNENYAKALENFEKASEYRQNDFYLWINIGYSRYKTADLAGAEEAYQRSLQLAPDYAQPNRYMGRFLLNNNQIEKGFEYLSKAAESDFEIYPELLHLARKQFSDKATEIEKSIQSNEVRTKKILAKYLIKHHLMTENVKTFLTSEALNENEKNEFIQYLIKKREFQIGYDVWASLSNHKINQERNLIFDGGFENLTESEEIGFGWQIIPRNEALAIFIDDKIHNSGKQAVKIKFDGQSKANTNVISQLIIVKPNQNYHLTFAVKSSELKTGGLPLINVADNASNKNIAQSKVINSTGGKWIQQTVDFRTNETSAITVSLQRMRCDASLCPILGELWLDDFSLKELKK